MTISEFSQSMDKKLLTSIEACNMLRTSTMLLDNDSEKYSYIPLVSLESEERRCNDSLRELKDSLKKLNLSFDFDKHFNLATYSKSPNTSVSSSEKNKLYSDSDKWESQNSFHAINMLLPPLHGANPQKGNIKEWTTDDYARTERNIYASIKYSYKQALIIWCPTLDVDSELVHTWLKKNATHIHDRWIHKDMPSATDAWGGVIAIYPDRITAKNAAEDIPQQHKLLKTITLSKIIQCFVTSELKYFSGEKTEVLVHAKVSGRQDIQMIESMLYRFGEVEFCGYDYLIRNGAVDFRVTYAFSTQAFLAKTILDNLPFGSGLLDVEVKMTPKAKAILDDFRCRLNKIVGNLYFPF